MVNNACYELESASDISSTYCFHFIKICSYKWNWFSGEGNGYSLQYSYLENPIHTWQATIHGVAKIGHD